MKAAAERQSNPLLREFLSIDPVLKRSDKKNSVAANILVTQVTQVKDFLG